MRRADFAYAHARMQARLAALPTAGDWQMIETSRSYPQCLDAAGRTALAPLIARLGRESSPAAVEEGLRLAWADVVADGASWAPLAWRPALDWMEFLPHLRSFAAGLAPAGAETEALTAQGEDEPALASVWRAGFAARLPAPDKELEAALAPLVGSFLFGPPPPQDDRAGLRARFERLFRARAQEPLAVFAWLGVMALEIERLRGALLVSLLFAAEGDGAEVV